MILKRQGMKRQDAKIAKDLNAKTPRLPGIHRDRNHPVETTSRVAKWGSPRTITFLFSSWPSWRLGV
ncbi:MAG: hypothetical protein IPM66_09165 [Acidobacteriota bacterium]|nr:MAG: hypothetical protein IPM66_09165 [Acidobacteriota bacterium]